ncbi:LnmK family bifunctional acyltransferase/decarboxylase [Streptomyces sp. NPDC045714]|uniref:LnmK family bifunctional acyltransferase/decarboxylase n=1 Tax=Streptomyces sp. NPDC045714 TaxID=3154913 RepID=UPI00340D9EE0
MLESIVETGRLRVDDCSLTRRVTVSPGMCGSGSLIYGRIGDWTWEAVAAACGTNVHAARTAEGRPAYLSFYYYRVRGGRVVHPNGLTFGDELRVDSRVFQFGSQSVLTLHRLAPADLALPEGPLDAAEVYERPHPDCLYVENVNRWITRSRPGSNQGLSEVAPSDFAHTHLPRLPNDYSPRTLVGRARGAGSFRPEDRQDLVSAGPVHDVAYTLDITRDINGVGLVYFASYFSIFDTALLSLWRSLGRDDGQFMRRKVVDQRIGYFSNADPGAALTLSTRRWRSRADPGIEVADMAMREAGTDRLLAVGCVELDVATTFSERREGG